MKKVTYVLATAALLAACSGNQGYTVTGTVDGAADGEVVYLQQTQGRQWVKLDSAVIKNGQFTLEGRQDTAKVCYLTYKGQSEEGRGMDFFLENGETEDMPIPADLEDEVMLLRDTSVENIASSDEDLMNRYLEEGTL